MGSSASKIIKNSTIYTIGNLVLKAFSILVIPICTNYLSTTEYGQFSLINNFVGVMVYVVGFCLYSAVVRFYTDYKKCVQDVAKYFSTTIWFMYISGFFFCIVALLGKKVLIEHVFKEMPFFPTVFLSIICVIFYAQYCLYQSILKSLEQATKYIIVSALYVIVHLLTLIYFVVIQHEGVAGAVVAQLISYVFCTGIMIVDLIKMGYIKFSFSMPMLKESMKYSIPLLPHSLSAQITQFVSKMFIQSQRTYAELGIFNLASQFGMLTDLIQNSFSMAIQPWFYSRMKEEGNRREEINKIVSVVLAFYAVVFGGIILFSREVIYLIADESYYEAWKVVPLIVFVFVFKMPYYFYVNVLFYHKRATKYIFTATLSSSILNAFLSYFFIWEFGMYGSIMADILAMIVRVMIVVILSVKIDNVGIRMCGFVKAGIILLLLVFASYLCVLRSEEGDICWEVILMKIMIYLAYILICLWMFKNDVLELISTKKRKGNTDE